MASDLTAVKALAEILDEIDIEEFAVLSSEDIAADVIVKLWDAGYQVGKRT
jgi:hypothetical protein